MSDSETPLRQLQHEVSGLRHVLSQLAKAHAHSTDDPLATVQKFKEEATVSMSRVIEIFGDRSAGAEKSLAVAVGFWGEIEDDVSY